MRVWIELPCSTDNVRNIVDGISKFQKLEALDIALTGVKTKLVSEYINIFMKLYDLDHDLKSLTLENFPYREINGNQLQNFEVFNVFQ